MPPLRDRLREWWRRNYMERGFGVLEPGYLRLRRKESMDYWHRWSELAATYPPRWYVAFFRGLLYISPDPIEVRRMLDGAMDREGIPRDDSMREAIRPSIQTVSPFRPFPASNSSGDAELHR